MLNGRPITLRGVNHHEHDPRLGHVIPMDSMLQDVLLMKRYNFNAVRLSHYPHDPKFYALCDELGLYVIDEANIETHGMGFYETKTLAAQALWEDAHLDRVMRMFERDKNHPCILIWSTGNEAGNGQSFRHAYAWLKRRDSSRPVQYENARLEPMWDSERLETIDYNTDLYVPMYPTPAKLLTYALKYEHDPAARPLVMCEYAHAMGNSCGGMLEYWTLINSFGVLQGGFIWDWVDQGLLLPPNSPKATAAARRAARRMLPPKKAAFAAGTSGLPRDDALDEFRVVAKRPDQPVWAYGGDYGPQNTPSDENFCINGLLQPDRQPNPHIFEVQYAQQPVQIAMGRQTPVGVELFLTNRHDFIALDSFTAQWILLEDGVQVRRGDIVLPPCAPGATVTVWANHTSEALPLPPQPAGVEVHLTVNVLPSEALEDAQHLAAVRSGRTMRDTAVEGAARMQRLVATEQFLLGVREGLTLGGLGIPAAPNAMDLAGQGALLNVTETPAPGGGGGDAGSGGQESEDAGEIEIAGANFSIRFSKVTGLPTQMVADGISRLQSPVLPNFWRPFNDNELGSGAHRRLSKWRDAGVPGKGHHKLLAPVSVGRSDLAPAGLAVAASVEVTPDGATLNTTCHVTVDGVLVVHAHLRPPLPMTRGEIPSIESLVSLRSVLGGHFLESDGGDELFVRNASGGEDADAASATARQQFTIRHFETREPGEPFTRSLSVIGDEPDTERVLRFGDIVSITAYTNRYLDAGQGQTVLASGQRQGEYGPLPPCKTQLFVVEFHGDDPFNIQEPHLGRAVQWGDNICLRALSDQLHTRRDMRGKALYLSLEQGAGLDEVGVSLTPDPAGWQIGQGDLVAPLRVGFSMRLHKDSASRVQWYGRGPHESYADRCGSAKFGQWSSTVAKQTHRYVRPQVSMHARTHTHTLSRTHTDTRTHAHTRTHTATCGRRRTATSWTRAGCPSPTPPLASGP